MPRVSEINTINKVFLLRGLSCIHTYISKYKKIFRKVKFLDMSSVYQNLKNLYLYKINIHKIYLVWGSMSLGEYLCRRRKSLETVQNHTKITTNWLE